MSQPWAGHGGHRRRGHSSPRVDPTSGMCSARERTMRIRCVEDLLPVTIPRGPLATQLLASATPVRGSTLCRAPSSPELAMATVAMWNSTAPKSNTAPVRDSQIIQTSFRRRGRGSGPRNREIPKSIHLSIATPDVLDEPATTHVARSAAARRPMFHVKHQLRASRLAHPT